MSIDNMLSGLRQSIIGLGLVALTIGCSNNKVSSSHSTGNTEKVEKKYINSFLEIQRMAESGDVNAQLDIGDRYRKGDGVPMDNTKAFEWFQKAAMQGNATAQYNVGLLYAIGRGVSQNSDMTIKWYQKAAAQGHSLAQFRLGDMYFFGDRVPKDLVLAYGWYSLMATYSNDLRDAGKTRKAECEKYMSYEELSEAKKLVSQWKVGGVLRRK